MSQLVTNFTEYFSKEADVYCQNCAPGSQISLSFQTGPGQWDSYLFPNTRDPVNLTQFVPFHAIKNSADFRKLINRQPPVLRLMTEQEYHDYFKNQATKTGKSVDQVMSEAEAKRTAVQTHSEIDPLAPPPLKVTDEAPPDEKTLKRAPTEASINPRVLHLALQVHDSLPQQQQMTAAQLLTELDNMGPLTTADVEHLVSRVPYKSVKSYLNKKLQELTADQDKD